jgi:hypothetical protein
LAASIIRAFGSVRPAPLCCFGLHITEYEQGGEGAQNFLGPRGVKYLNTGLLVATVGARRSDVDIADRTYSYSQNEGPLFILSRSKAASLVTISMW